MSLGVRTTTVPVMVPPMSTSAVTRPWSEEQWSQAVRTLPWPLLLSGRRQCVCVCLFVWRAVLHVFLCACVSMYVLWVVWTRNPPPSAVNGEGPSAVVGTGESPFSSFTSRCFVHCATLPAYPPHTHTHTHTPSQPLRDLR